MNAVEDGKESLNKLRALYERSDAARALLDHFSQRKNAMRETTVDRLLAVLRGEGAEISRGDVIEVLKNLEAAGCGTFTVGRRGKPTRFEWEIDLVSVGQAAAGKRKELDQISDEAVEEEPDDEWLTHSFQLRAGEQVKFDLPRDFSAREAQRLGDFIRTLPFGTGGEA